ncbi:extracellular solute-binding protein [Cohnella rhizosphaerae]|uniref:Extracellular solute-binding protein n=1 Tax=Cohnella rhizosphaerae TaxID=1457232 RepID=A0A9X4QSW8_9BACL|nr:extracellular solute-binding protein [Cohnella rhizosphaerae]MDG0809037.1 extracellular solute-binding protein [Cohnella rhizosphaerae]
MKFNRVMRSAVGLAAIPLMASALAACGGNNANTDSSASEAASSSAASSSGAASSASSGSPAASGQKVTLKILVPNNIAEFPSGKDVNHNEIADGIRERTGFDVQWELMPKDAEALHQKLNVLMASGDTPDLIIMGNSEKAQFGNFAQQGLLTPLDALLDEDGQNIKSLLTPEQWKSAMWDGQIYAIRTFSYSNASYGLTARKDVLTELGLGLPKTQDEFYDALKTIKEKKPGMAPYTANLSEGLTGLEAIASMFYPPVDYVQKKGKVVYTAAQPEAKDFLAFASKLFAEGLIDKESVVNKTDNVKEKLSNGKAALATLGWWEGPAIVAASKEKNANSDLAYIDPPTGSNGSFGMGASSTISKYFIIPKASKHAKEVVQFLNKASDPAVIDFISFGIEGTHFKKGKRKERSASGDEQHRLQGVLQHVRHRRPGLAAHGKRRPQPVLHPGLQSRQVRERRRPRRADPAGRSEEHGAEGPARPVFPEDHHRRAAADRLRPIYRKVEASGRGGRREGVERRL